MIGDNETFLSTRRHNTRSYARIPLCILRKLGTKAITQNFPRRCKRQSEKRKGGEKKKKPAQINSPPRKPRHEKNN